MTTHSDILNQLLSNCCGVLPADAVKQNEGFQQFIVDVCCGQYRIEAKLLNDKMPFQYEVRSFMRVS